MRLDFASDNTSGMAPEALAALTRANTGFERSYGTDSISQRAADEIRHRLDADVEVRFLFSGTAANAIALSMLAEPFEAVLAHREAHVCTDETGAPGFFGRGLGLIGLSGPSGRINPAALEAALAVPEVGHRQPPASLSLSQATEYGAVYSAEDMRALIIPAKARGLGVHVDGARLANAVAAGFDPKSLASMGVDILVWGGAKAGAGCVEALVLFDRTLASRIDNRLKQSGQTASKGRLLVAPLLGLLETGQWEAGAVHANAMAARLATGITARCRHVLAHPIQANTVFVTLSEEDHRRIVNAGWACYRFDDGSVRFVCSWATTPDAVDELVEQLADQ